MLCERGIRTFERATRHTLDLNAVVLVRERSHLPVVVDPSHAAGVASLVTPLAEASLAAGAAGLIVEVHPNPKQAMSDGPQSLDIPMFIELARRVHPDLERRKVRPLHRVKIRCRSCPWCGPSSLSPVLHFISGGFGIVPDTVMVFLLRRISNFTVLPGS